VLSVQRHLRRLQTDPWSDYWTTSQSISTDVIAAVRMLT
jgi:hypothetical protein